VRGACAIFFCSPSSVTVYPTPLCRARLGGEVPGLDEFTMAQEWVDQKMEKAKDEREKRGSSSNFAIEEEEDELERFPASVVGSASSHGADCKDVIISSQGFESYADPNEKPVEVVLAKVNQDSAAYVWPLNEDEDAGFFCVLDGHGYGGEGVSQYASKRLCEIMFTGENGRTQAWKEDPAKSLVMAFLEVDKDLATKKASLAKYGGSTCVCVMMIGNKCTIANVGDSRFVSGVRDRDGKTAYYDMSHDHRPDDKKEKARIVASGGWVATDAGDDEARVWLTSKQACGLAMARTLGDLPFKAVGVIAEPEITEMIITTDHEFMIGASDGVWTVMSSQEAVDIVAKSKERQPNQELDATRAARELLVAAARKWKTDEGGEYRDDITVTVIKLPCFPAARAQLVRNPAKDSAAEASPTKGAAGRRKSTAESVERRKSNLAASKKGGRRSIA